MQFSSYKVNRKHRGRVPTDDASMWSVSEWDEVFLFATAQASGWMKPGENVLWAIRRAGKSLCKLGDDPENPLYIAKYTTDHNSEWHGYPVHPRKDDIPPECVLERWREAGLIDKTDKKRIQGGKFR